VLKQIVLKMTKHIILYTYIILGSGVLFANIYNSVVDVAIWGSDIPNSIETARNYFKQTTPADFYKFVGAALHLIGLVTLVLFWKSFPNTRWYLVAAFVLFMLVDVFTVTYFFPRNDIMFHNAPLTDIELLKQSWQEWNTMNWIRSLIALGGVICSCAALDKVYKLLK